MPPKVMGEDTTHESDAVEALNVIEQAAIGVQVTAAATVQSAKRVQHTIEDVSTRMYEERDIKELSKGEAFAILGLGAKGDYAAILRVAGEIDKDAVESTALGDTEDGTEVRRRNRDRAIALLNHENADIRKETRRVLAERIAQRQRLYGKNEHFKRLTNSYLLELSSHLDKSLIGLVETASIKQEAAETRLRVEELRQKLDEQLRELLDTEIQTNSTAESLRRQMVLGEALRRIHELTSSADFFGKSGKSAREYLTFIVNATANMGAFETVWEKELASSRGGNITEMLATVMVAKRYLNGESVLQEDQLKEARDNNHSLYWLRDGLENNGRFYKALVFRTLEVAYRQRPKTIDHPDEIRQYLVALFEKFKDMWPEISDQQAIEITNCIKDPAFVTIDNDSTSHPFRMVDIMKRAMDKVIGKEATNNIVGSDYGGRNSYNEANILIEKNSGLVSELNAQILQDMQAPLEQSRAALAEEQNRLEENLPRHMRNKEIVERLLNLSTNVKNSYRTLMKNAAEITLDDISKIIAVGPRLGMSETDIAYLTRYGKEQQETNTIYKEMHDAQAALQRALNATQLPRKKKKLVASARGDVGAKLISMNPTVEQQKKITETLNEIEQLGSSFIARDKTNRLAALLASLNEQIGTIEKTQEQNRQKQLEEQLTAIRQKAAETSVPAKKAPSNDVYKEDIAMGDIFQNTTFEVPVVKQGSSYPFKKIIEIYQVSIANGEITGVTQNGQPITDTSIVNLGWEYLFANRRDAPEDVRIYKTITEQKIAEIKTHLNTIDAALRGLNPYESLTLIP